MDLSTKYLGLNLSSPLVMSASPMSESLDNLKRAEDSGAGAVVMYSLFEEQIRREIEALDYHLTFGTDSYAEALTYFPEPETYHAGPERYLQHIRDAKESLSIPVIASLNGSHIGGWTRFAKKIEQAGADALELNIYNIPTNIDMSGEDVESTYLEVVRSVKEVVNIPVAVKLSPFFSNMANMAKQFKEAGADGLVMFNRFYQPDIDLETLEVKPNVLLSTPQSLRLPLRWIAILYGRVDIDFAATSGVHFAEDALKLLMVGANVTMMASALFKHGISHIATVEVQMRAWMLEHGYESVQQMRGSISQKNAIDPEAFERAQYMRAVTNYPTLPKA
jgi:dihydroorotate dehydrogenase (fumarate)